MNKSDWKSQIRKSRYVKGKKLTKKELGDIMEGMIKLNLLKEKKKKENWKEPNQPKSIKEILNGNKGL